MSEYVRYRVQDRGWPLIGDRIIGGRIANYIWNRIWDHVWHRVLDRIRYRS